MASEKLFFFNNNKAMFLNNNELCSKTELCIINSKPNNTIKNASYFLIFNRMFQNKEKKND